MTYYLTDKELRETDPPTTHDNTMRCLLDNCRRKTYWHFRGVDYAERPAYFTWGSAWGIILNTWYSGGGPKTEVDTPEWTLAKNEAIAAGLAFWDKLGTLDLGVSTRDALTYKWQTYLHHYPKEDWTPVSFESGFVWPLPKKIGGDEYFVAGSLDAYIDWPPYGLLLLENKSAGIPIDGDKYVGQWAFSSQITTYIWYLTQLLDQEIFGALMNLTSKKVPGPRTRVMPTHHLRTLEKRNSFQLKEFEIDFSRYICDLLIEWEDWTWPKTTNSIECTGGIGKSPCLYAPLCKAAIPPYDLDPFNYTNLAPRAGKWEPWTREGTEEVT